jgi:hypothetical protein
MTNRNAQTAPPFIPSQIGSGLADWTTIAAGTLLFLLPVAIFTFMLRGHLLRGVTVRRDPQMSGDSSSCAILGRAQRVSEEQGGHHEEPRPSGLAPRARG